MRNLWELKGKTEKKKKRTENPTEHLAEKKTDRTGGTYCRVVQRCIPGMLNTLGTCQEGGGRRKRTKKLTENPTEKTGGKIVRKTLEKL